MATIQDIRAVNDPQRAYEFEFEILANTAAGSFPVLTQRVETVSIPEETIETIDINFKSSKTSYAGRDGSGRVFSVTLWDTQSRDTYRFIKNWLAAIRNPVTGGGVTKDLYAAEGVIRTFATDSETVTGLHRLTKLYPTSIGDISMSYESSEHLRFDVTFSYESNLFE